MVKVRGADAIWEVPLIRVLFIEDNAMNRRVVGAMLHAGGMEMSEAGDAEAGLRMAAAHDYDVILTDLRMPGMDGVAAIRHIRARPDPGSGVPILVVTADAGAAIEAECRAAGADGVILKPLSMAALFGAIGAVVARRGAAA